MERIKDENSLASFLIVEDIPLEIFDRSTAEQWSICPAQAAYKRAGRFTDASPLADAGQAVHVALSRALSEYVESRGAMTSRDLVESAEWELDNARPDIQPDAIAAGRRSLWPWAKYIRNVHWQNVLKFDGGKGELSGQLAVDWPDLGVRVTSELDLLHAGPAVEVVDEVDYKSGWRTWTEAQVAESFQFAFHAFLILENFPDVETLRVRVWDFRRNRPTYPVAFERARLGQYAARIRQSAAAFARWRQTPAADVETWPGPVKCAACPAAAICSGPGGEVADLAKDPAVWVDEMVRLDARLSSMKKLASAWVANNGEMESPSGARFGFQKPPAKRKPSAAFYTAETNGGSDE